MAGAGTQPGAWDPSQAALRDLGKRRCLSSIVQAVPSGQGCCAGKSMHQLRSCMGDEKRPCQQLWGWGTCYLHAKKGLLSCVLLRRNVPECGCTALAAKVQLVWDGGIDWYCQKPPALLPAHPSPVPAPRAQEAWEHRSGTNHSHRHGGEMEQSQHWASPLLEMPFRGSGRSQNQIRK